MAGGDLERLESGITTEYWGAPSFYTFHDENTRKWLNNEPVIGGHADIGRLVIEPDLLERATWEVGARTGEPNLTFREVDHSETKASMSPFLHRFVETCRDRFAELVQRDAQNYPNKHAFGEGYMQLGQYVPQPFDVWHADRKTYPYPAKVPTDITYTMRIVGEPTVYSAQHHCHNDLDIRGNLVNAPEGITTYSPGVASVHHGAMAPHSGPDHSHPRFFMNYRLYDAFGPTRPIPEV